MVIRKFDSATWKGIAKQVQLVQKGMGKNIINARRTLFWKDIWLGSYILEDLLLTPLKQEEARYMVADYWDGSNWKWTEFQEKLPSQLLLKLAAHMVHINSNINDSYTWKPNSTGAFSVNSAYWLQVNVQLQYF